ncbi:MAG: hypothetical protein AB7V45_02510 [Candidatus Krumholzibacteriia bacterium]
MSIADYIGVAGFALAVLTFALTRWERRVRLGFEFFTDWDKRFRDEFVGDNGDPIVIARVINTGQVPVILDRESFVFLGEKKRVPQFNADFFGKDAIPAPLNPGQCLEVGILLEAFAGLVEAGEKDIVPLGLEVKDVSGRTFRSKDKFELLMEVHEIQTRNWRS